MRLPQRVPIPPEKMNVEIKENTSPQVPKINPGFSRLLATNVMYWICAGVYAPFLSAYFTRLGFNAFQVGLLLSVQPICALFVQPMWSFFADHFGRRKQVAVILCLAASAISLTYYLNSSFLGVLMVTLFFSIFFQALLPLCDSLVIEASARSGLEFSRIRMGGTIGYAVVVFLVGHIFEVSPWTQFIFVSSALIVFALQLSRLPQPWHENVTRAFSECSHEECGPDKLPKGRGILAIFDTKEISLILGLALVDFIGLGFHSTFLGAWCIDLGHGQDLVGTLSAVSAASEIPILIISKRLIGRFGEVRLLTFSCAVMALRLLLVGTGSVPVMVAAQILQSVSYMTVYFCCVTYVSSHTYANTKARGQSILAALQSGLAMIVANLLGGVLCDAFGIGAAFRMFAVIEMLGLAAVLAVFLGIRHKRSIQSPN